MSNLEDLTGRELDDRYQLMAVLAKGETSTVYMAQDSKLGRRVAVRVPFDEFAIQKGFAEAFGDAARTMSDLNHDGLVRLLDFGTDGETQFAVVQYVPGGTLTDRIKEAGGKLPQADIAVWLPKIAAAIDYLHTQGETHGGVSASRMLFDTAPADRIFLVDHAMGRALRAAAGDPPDGMEPPSPADDQHGLATSIYEALGGTLPWTGKDEVEARVIRSKKPAKPIKGLSKDLNAVLMRALDQDPDGRFSKCASFARSFVECAEVAPAAEAASTSSKGTSSKGTSSKGTSSKGTAPKGKSSKGKSPKAPAGPMETASDSATLAFGRARPAAPVDAAPAGDTPDFGATKPITMRRGNKGISGGVVLVLFLIMVAVALAALVAGRDKGTKKAVKAVDNTAPVITITSPTDRMVVKEEEITLEGTVDDKEAIVLISGNPVLVDGEGKFSTVVRLPKEGEQAIKLEARDDSSNESKAQVIVVRDTTPPLLSMISPSTEQAATPTTATHVQLQGKAGDPTDVVTVNGKPIAVADDGIFETSVEIPKNGANKIDIVSRDAVGNEARASVTVQRRLIVCCETLEILRPGDGFTTRKETVEVRGRLEAPGVRVWIGDTEVTLDSEGFFKGSVALPTEGPQVIEVRAEGAAGEKGSKSVRVLRDLTPPTVTLLKPTRLAENPDRELGTSAGDMEFAGTVEDATNAKVFVNGYQTSVTGNKWSATIPVSLGDHKIVIEAWDDAGNRSEPIVRKLFLPRPTINGMKYKGENANGYHEYTLLDDPTVELVLIPGSGYERGALEADEAAKDNERPRHHVTVSAFLITRTEITWEQFMLFSAKAKYELPSEILPEDYVRTHPAVNLTWQDASAYCKWAKLSLPTEGEWERAARGNTSRVYPWGDAWDAKKANATSSQGKTSPAAQFDPFGEFLIYDAAGNAAEWCADWYSADSYTKLTQHDPTGPSKGTERVVRGGSWKDDPKDVRISSRRSAKPDARDDSIGFRAVFRIK